MERTVAAPHPNDFLDGFMQNTPATQETVIKELLWIEVVTALQEKFPYEHLILVDRNLLLHGNDEGLIMARAYQLGIQKPFKRSSWNELLNKHMIIVDRNLIILDANPNVPEELFKVPVLRVFLSADGKVYEK